MTLNSKFSEFQNKMDIAYTSMENLGLEDEFKARVLGFLQYNEGVGTLQF
jgi:hypothetical protein